MKVIKYRVSDLNEVTKKYGKDIDENSISFKDSIITFSLKDQVLFQYDLRTKVEKSFEKYCGIENERVVFDSMIESINESFVKIEPVHFIALVAHIFTKNRSRIMERYEHFQKSQIQN